MGTCEVVAPHKIGPYILKDELGRGSFSMVCRAVHEHTNEEFACKIIPKRRLLAGHSESRFEDEVRILQHLDHPSICRMYDLSQDAINYYIILELCSHGNLYTRIRNAKKLTEDDAKFIFKQIVNAVEYMHRHGVAHRDLKPENILVDERDRVKIIDFGLSAFQHEGTLLHDFCGSVAYASPECISEVEHDGGKSDIWSLGVILYTMLLGQLPWTYRNRPQQIDQILRGEFFVSVAVSNSARSLIYSMMNIDANARPSLEKVLDSPWFSGVKDPECEFTKMPPLAGQKVDMFFAPPRTVTHHAARESEGRLLLKLMRRRTVMDNRLGVTPRSAFSRKLRRSPVAQSLQLIRL